MSRFQILDKLVTSFLPEKGMNSSLLSPQLYINSRADRVIYIWYYNRKEEEGNLLMQIPTSVIPCHDIVAKPSAGVPEGSPTLY